MNLLDPSCSHNSAHGCCWTLQAASARPATTEWQRPHLDCTLSASLHSPGIVTSSSSGSPKPLLVAGPPGTRGMARWLWCTGEAVPRVMLLVLLVVAIVLAATTLVRLTALRESLAWCIFKCASHAAIVLAATLW